MDGPKASQLSAAFLRFCEGDFAFRLPRTMTRDEADTNAFFFNSVADELERIIKGAREQEARLTQMTQVLSQTLLKVAAGDLTVQAQRDFRGDPTDVLVFLVNNTITELATLVRERQQQGEQERETLNRLVAERTAQLKDSEANFRKLFDASPVALILSRVSDNTIVAANPQATTLFGVEADSVVGRGTKDFWVNQAEREALVARVRAEGMVDGFETQLRREGGEAFWCNMAVRSVRIGGERALLAGTRDITDQKRLEAQLRELATTDALTGTLNRRRLFEVAEAECERAERYERPLSLAMLDLDHFKAVNDRFGHQVGDEVLREVASVIKKELRKPDWVGRYGGEELTVVFPETSLADAAVVGERIRKAVERIRLSHAGVSVGITVSVGIVDWRPGEALEDLLRRADQALYSAKASGRNKVMVGAAKA